MHRITEHNNRIRIAVLESQDGLKWKRITGKNDYVKGFEENNVIVDNCEFVNNTATNGPGAIRMTSKHSLISDYLI